MNKILRYSFVALLAMVFMPSFAEDIIWQEDFSSYSANDVPSGGTYNYVCTDNGTNNTKIYTESSAGGTSPELLIGKKNTKAKNPDVLGTFSATINLNGKSGDMYLSFKANGNLTIEITGGTLGEKTATNNDYNYPITGASGTLTIKFTNNITSNIRIDNIKLYQGTAKKPAGLSWGKASAYVTLGNSDESYKYIPTLSNVNNLSVTCTSSDPSVATVTNEGVVTPVAAGKTTIKAAFAGNDEYEAAEVSYELTVNPAPVETPLNISEFNELSTSTVGVLQLTDAQVLALGNSYFVVKDANGVIMIKETRTEGAISATQGQKLSGTIKGKKAAFGGVNGIQSITASEINVSDGTITPVAATVTEIAGKELLTEVYKLENVTIKKDNNNYFIMNGDEKVLQIYDEFKLNAISADGVYTLEGLRGKYNTTEQFWPTNVTLVTGVGAIKADADVNAPAYNLKGQRVTEGYKGLVIKNGKKVINK